VSRDIAARSRNDCYHGKAKSRYFMFFLICMRLWTTQKCSVSPRRSKPEFPWHYLPTTKLFVLLSKV